MSNIEDLYNSLKKRKGFENLKQDEFESDMNDAQNRYDLFTSLSKIEGFPKTTFIEFSSDIGKGVDFHGYDAASVVAKAKEKPLKAKAEPSEDIPYPARAVKATDRIPKIQPLPQSPSRDETEDKGGFWLIS